MNSIKYILIILISVCLYSCWEEDENPIDKLNPPLSGKIVSVDRNDGLKVLDLTTMNSVSYGDANNSKPIWSYDGSEFAQSGAIKDSIEDSYLGSIKIVNIKTNSIKNWRRDSGRGYLTWSPDGNTIAYLEGGTQHSFGIISDCYINYLNTTTGEITKTYMSLPDSLQVSAISWHPDGEKIAIGAYLSLYHRYENFTQFIYLIDPYDENIQEVSPLASIKTKSAYKPNYLDWSLDGEKLLISDYLDDIYVLEYEEKSIQMIPYIRRGHSACWSPDGNYVLYVDWIWTGWDSAHSELHLTDINGSFDLDMKIWGESMLVDWR